ncbi:MAG: hypothetical protein AB1898_28590 [Acidobacteriota bacterium]
MNEPVPISSAPPVSTWELLRNLGFTEDRTVFSDLRPGLSFDFGNFKLSASAVTNLRAARIVLLSGVLVTARTITQVGDELPMEVESVEQGKAYLASCLDNAAGGTFEPQIAPPWLEEAGIVTFFPRNESARPSRPI